MMSDPIVRTSVITAAALLSVAAGVFALLKGTAPDATKAAVEDLSLLVETIPVELEPHVVHIRAQGTTTAAQQITLQVEVIGRVVWQSDALVPGGRFKKGQAMLRIDPRDHQLAVEQQRASVDKAQLELEIERGRKIVAEREWAILNNGNTVADSPGKTLALREPHLRTAKVALGSAGSGLRRAEINLERTTVRAPFNAFVQKESVDYGQLLTPAAPLGTLVGTDEFWVTVSIATDKLVAIRLPRGTKPGATARVWQELGGQRLERVGRVIRLMGDVDPVGRMARLLVEIDDPMDDGIGGLPLLLGSYVEVEIEGPALSQVIELPRKALHEGDKVYVMTAEQRLSIRDVEVAWRLNDVVLIDGGLTAEDRVIVSRVPTPVEGMTLRTATTAHEPVASGESNASEVTQ